MSIAASRPDTSKGALDVPKACAFLGGISRAQLYSMMGKGLIPFVMVGHRRMILQSALEAYLLEQVEARK